MKHDIDVLGCGVIYIDKERVFGSKPYGLFSTVNWKATDEDLKRIADRCLEVISDRKTENCSEKPNDCESCLHASECDWEPWQECPYKPKDEPQLCRECDDYAGDGMYCASNHIVYDFSTSKGNCEPQTDCP